MAVSVPSAYTNLVQEAATATGLPYSVVAAQAYTESSFNATATSSSDAEGWLQFLPSTYDEYAAQAGVPEGTEYNPADEEKVYVQYMNALLKEYHGDVLEALNAYNGAQTINGEPNPYGPNILKLAGTGDITVSGNGTTTNATTTSFPGGSLDPLNWISSLGNTAEQHLLQAFEDIFKDFGTKAKDWGIRLGLMLLGLILIYAGLRSITGIRVSSIIQTVAPESSAASNVAKATATSRQVTSAPRTTTP